MPIELPREGEAWKTGLVATALVAALLPTRAPAQEPEPSYFPGDWFGESIAQVDDLDCDGVRDFAVGMPHCRTMATGGEDIARVFVFSARTGALLHELASSRTAIGEDLRALPDLDGDGMGEIASGAAVFSGWTGVELSMTPPAASSVGFTTCFQQPREVHSTLRVPLPTGSSLSIGTVPLSRFTDVTALALRTPESNGELLILSERRFGSIGSRAAWVGDFDRDGASDFAYADHGWVHVHSGSSGRRLRSVGGSTRSSDFGDSIAGGADLNGDRVPDLLVGDGDHRWIETFSGATGGLISRIDSANLGCSVAFLDDLDGDGVAELAAGSLISNDPADFGAVLVFSGRTSRALYVVRNPHGEYGIR